MMSILFAAVFFAAATCFACFNEDPESNTGNSPVTIQGEDGGKFSCDDSGGRRGSDRRFRRWGHF